MTDKLENIRSINAQNRQEIRHKLSHLPMQDDADVQDKIATIQSIFSSNQDSWDADLAEDIDEPIIRILQDIIDNYYDDYIGIYDRLNRIEWYARQRNERSRNIDAMDDKTRKEYIKVQKERSKQDEKIKKAQKKGNLSTAENIEINNRKLHQLNMEKKCTESLLEKYRKNGDTEYAKLQEIRLADLERQITKVTRTIDLLS